MIEENFGNLRHGMAKNRPKDFFQYDSKKGLFPVYLPIPVSPVYTRIAGHPE